MKKRYKKIILSPKSTIGHAVQTLNLTGLKIILIISKDNKLLGTVTDGDIRRAFLKKFTLKTSLIEIANKKPIYVFKKNSDPSKVFKIMKIKNINRVPVLDREKKVIDLYCLEDFMSQIKENIFFIMAGGKGKRLMPLTKSTPKPLLLIKKKPIILNIIEKAKNEGFHNFYISVKYLADKIIKYLGDGSKFGVKIKYIKEKQFLGTAGSLSLAKFQNKKPVLLTNGDIITEVNYGNLIDFHVKNKAFLTIGVRIEDSQNQYGLIELKGSKVESFLEKPITRSYINAGIYVFNPEIKSFIKKHKKIDIPQILEILNKKKKKIIVYPFHEKWIDLGTKKNLKDARS